MHNQIAHLLYAALAQNGHIKILTLPTTAILGPSKNTMLITTKQKNS
jgi:hypothetical protein